MKREEYNYWLSNLRNIGAVKIDFLLQVLGSAEEVFQASRHALEKVKESSRRTNAKMTEADLAALLEHRDIDRIQEAYGILIKKGIQFISKESEAYPEKLRQIYGAPFSLYVRGRIPKKDERALAIIGTRECSAYGRDMARYFAGEIAKEGIFVISGLARGIDSYAHEGVLNSGGLTYGVLGCGIDICYPKENLPMYMDMIEKGGILSEYPPGVQPLAGHFPMRNRIISGLSDGILVIEAKRKSGSFITVDIGLEQGKDIYALPGRITDKFSEGCNGLIKMGAKLVTSPQDILEDFIPGFQFPLKEEKRVKQVLKENERKIISCLDSGPKHIEEISCDTMIPIDELLEHLLVLELRGLIHQTMRNYYSA